MLNPPSDIYYYEYNARTKIYQGQVKYSLFTFYCLVGYRCFSKEIGCSIRSKINGFVFKYGIYIIKITARITASLLMC